MIDLFGDKIPMKERVIKYVKFLDEYIDELKTSRIKEIIRVDIRSSLNDKNKREVTASLSVAWNASINFRSVEQIDETIKNNRIIEGKLIELKEMMQKEINLTK